MTDVPDDPTQPPATPPPPPPPAPFGPPPGPSGYPSSPTSTNGFAVASLVLGILFLCGIAAILALVFGYIGRNQIDRSGGTQGGRGLAVAGIVLGWIGVGLFVAGIIASAATS
jgi:hypothetical protein